MRISHHYNTNSMVCVTWEKQWNKFTSGQTKKRHRENLFFEIRHLYFATLFEFSLFKQEVFGVKIDIFAPRSTFQDAISFWLLAWCDGCFQKVKSNTKREWNDTPENEIVWVLLIRSLSSSCNFSASTSSSSSNAEASSKG